MPPYVIWLNGTVKLEPEPSYDRWHVESTHVVLPGYHISDLAIYHNNSEIIISRIWLCCEMSPLK